MSDVSTKCKALTANLRAAMADFEASSVQTELVKLFAADAKISLCHPFGELLGPQSFYDAAFMPLLQAIPDLERREMIVMAGETPEGQDWIGMMGNYMGTFTAPFLDIPPTGHLVHMRYHEYYRIEGDQVTEVQAI